MEVAMAVVDWAVECEAGVGKVVEVMEVETLAVEPTESEMVAELLVAGVEVAKEAAVKVAVKALLVGVREVTAGVETAAEVREVTAGA